MAHFDHAFGATLVEALTAGDDPGYAFFNWLVASWRWGIYGVNLLCGVIFFSGLIIFCRQQVDPLLAFAVSVLYLIIVVAMGYTRQGVALGLLLWAISYLERGKFVQNVAFIAIAALFHKTVLIMIPFGVFLYGEGRLLRTGSILLAGYGLWDALLAQQQDALWENYIDVPMISEGARIQVLMNVLPGLLLLIYWRQW